MNFLAGQEPIVARSWGLNNFSIKWIAIITMLIDHAGMILFPQYRWLRVIGRLAFPLFCFLLAEGAIHTSNMGAYLRRMFIFALISDIPFELARRGRISIDGLDTRNVFFTLFLGLLAIYGMKRFHNQVLMALWAALMVLAAQVLNTDYGSGGVLFILAFYLLYRQLFLKMAAFGILNLFMFSGIQAYALCSIPIMLLYNGKPGPRRLKYFFYVFYPAHLLVLALIRNYWNTGHVFGGIW